MGEPEGEWTDRLSSLKNDDDDANGRVEAYSKIASYTKKDIPPSATNPFAFRSRLAALWCFRTRRLAVQSRSRLMGRPTAATATATATATAVRVDVTDIPSSRLLTFCMVQIYIHLHTSKGIAPLNKVLKGITTPTAEGKQLCWVQEKVERSGR